MNIKHKININTKSHWNTKYAREHRGHPHKVVFTKHKVLYDKIVDIIFAYRHNTMLDLGAGLGPVPYLLKRRNFDFKNRLYLCVDFSDVGLRKAQEVIPEIKIHTSKIDVPLILPNEYKKFDIVICSEVLEHLTDYLECLKNINKYLAPDGIAIVSVPYGKIMIKEHYHMYISTEELIMHHEAVGLFPFSTTIVNRWQIMLSRKMVDQDVANTCKTKVRQTITNLCIPDTNKSISKNIC